MYVRVNCWRKTTREISYVLHFKYSDGYLIAKNLVSVSTRIPRQWSNNGLPAHVFCYNRERLKTVSWVFSNGA